MRIGLIGAGNVAWNIAAGLENSSFQILQVLSRSGDSAEALAEEFNISSAGRHPQDLRVDLDLVILATSDHSVQEAAEAIAAVPPNITFVHTSGSIALQALDSLGARIGVFYPMQTFTRGRLADWKEVPLFLEGDSEVLSLLRPLADYLSDRVYEMDSQDRLRLHLGAVYASNFANFMWLLAEDAARHLPEGDLSIYAPLIREVVDKAFAIGPEQAHTGPARRGDEVTMQKHLQLLKGDEQDLYHLISKMIFDRFRPE